MTRSLSANFTCWRPEELLLPREEIRRLTEIANTFVSELLARKASNLNTTVKSYHSNQ